MQRIPFDPGMPIADCKKLDNILVWHLGGCLSANDRAPKYATVKSPVVPRGDEDVWKAKFLMYKRYDTAVPLTPR